MRSSERSWLAAPGLWAAGAPRIAGLLLLGLMLAAMAVAPQLRFDPDIYRSFSSGNPHLAAYADFLQRAGPKPRHIVVLAEADEPMPLDAFEHIRDISLDISLLDGVGAVVSIGTARFPEDAAVHAGQPLLPLDMHAKAFPERLRAFEKSKPLSSILLTGDRKAAVIHVVVEDDAPPGAPLALAGAVSGLLDAAAPSGLRFAITGEDLIGPEIVRALKDDLVLYTVAGGIVALVFAGWLFRDARLILACIAPAGIAGLFSLAVFVVLDIPVTVVNNVVPILIFILALADCVHLTIAYARDRQSRDEDAALANVIESVGPACALTSVTTAIAFAAIFIVGDAQIRELSLVGGVAVFAGYVAMIVAFPVLVRMLRPGGRPGGASPPAAIRRLAIRAVSSSRKTAVAGLLVTFAGLVMCWQAEPWFTLQQNLPLGGSVRSAERQVADRFGGFYRLWVEFPHGAVESDGGDAARRLAALSKAASGYPVISHSLVMAWSGGEASGTLPFLSLLEPQDGIERMVVLMPEPMRSRDTLQVYDRVERAASNLGANLITGLPTVLRHEASVLVYQMALSLAVACVVACLLVALAFGRLWIAAVLVMPNMLPLLLSAGLYAGLSGWRIGPSAVLALTVAFGIAIDDSIHFVSRYLQARDRNAPLEAALGQAANRAGWPMAITTALICAGLSVPLFSSFETVRAFAGIQVAALAVALVADLVLLPALIHLRENRR